MAEQRFIPIGVDFDTSPQYLKTDTAYLLKGIELGWILVNEGAQNELELKPAEGNYLYCSVDLPAGLNTVIGYLYYQESNEGYVFVHNDNGWHLIYRLIGNTLSAQTVYRFPQHYPGIVDDPQYYFSEGRIAMKSICRFLPNGDKELYKELFLVNKQVQNLRIVVEDSINTNSFTTPFFTTKDKCCNSPYQIIKSGVPEPLDKINIVPIPVTDADKFTQNKMLFRMFQFRLLDENAWGQRSEYGLVSDQYVNSLAACSRDAASQPHCVWLEMPVPCPEIVRRTVCVRSCTLAKILGTDASLFSDWTEAFTINLYDQTNPQLRWYERQYDITSKEFEFFDDFKKMRIKFCNNRQCIPIALKDLRDQNPAPFTSGSVASIGKELLYGDNVNDLPKFPKEDIDSVKLELVKGQSCEVKFSHIKVYAVVHNFDDNKNNPVYRKDGVTGFGGIGSDLDVDLVAYEQNAFNPEKGLQENGGYGQRFPDGVVGFRAGLAGTNYTAESKQFLWTPTDLTEQGYDYSLEFLKQMRDIKPGSKLLVQCFDFGLVALGKYFFRIFGHDNTQGMALANTSTYYIVTTSWNDYKATLAVGGGRVKEIFIDTTNGNDYDSLLADKVAVIQDITYPGDNAFCVRGYLFEDDKGKQPIELAEVHKSRGDDFIPNYTDHNGFFWWTTQYGQDFRLILKSLQKCTYGTVLGQTGIKKNRGTTLVPNLYANTIYPTYATDACNRYIVTGKVAETTGAGIEGIAVVLAHTKPVLTNSRGEFRVVAHFSTTRNIDQLVMAMGGGCYVLDNDCKPIAIDTTVTQPPCVNCLENLVKIGPAGGYPLKTVSNKGFPKGSRIQFAMTGYEWMGRRTDIQTSEDLFIDFPTEQEQGDETFPRLKVTLPARFSSEICKYFNKIVFSFSKNTNFEDFFTWSADQVDFVDNTDEINTVNPSKVKIWYRSLNEYNLMRGLHTNTTWSIKDANGDTRLGDVVEFIRSAEGEYLPPNTIGNVQHDVDGRYFLVDFDESLRKLKDGVKFKLKRPYECEQAKTFYEYAFVAYFCNGDCIPRDVDGKVIKEFFLDGYSSYSINRQIPVVKDVVTKVPASDGGTQDKITQTKTLKIYPYTFEHHSPSDTWGDHCNNGGRVNGINPYEGIKCNRNQVLMTGALNQANDGAINYLHYFSMDFEFVIDEQGWGGITAILVRDDGQLLLVCDQTTFSFRTNDDRATVDENGYVRLPINSLFSKPERNPSFNFGCQKNDVNTIRRYASLVFYLDSQKQAFIVHDFKEANDISADIQPWLIASIKEVGKSNGKKFWHSTLDFRLNRIYLTKFDRDSRKYVNKDIPLRPDLNETMGYNFFTKKWLQYHFTPEYFGSMNSDKKDSQLFAFRNALPYAHHDATLPRQRFLNYFGEQCIPHIGVVTNAGGTADKYFLACKVECKEQLFIMQELETSIGQKSQVFSGAWEFAAGASYAAYFCDVAEIDNCDTMDDVLLDGDSLYGKWLKALYVADDYNGEFFRLTGIVSYFEPL